MADSTNGQQAADATAGGDLVCKSLQNDAGTVQECTLQLTVKLQDLMLAVADAPGGETGSETTVSGITPALMAMVSGPIVAILILAVAAVVLWTRPPYDGRGRASGDAGGDDDCCGDAIQPWSPWPGIFGLAIGTGLVAAALVYAAMSFVPSSTGSVDRDRIAQERFLQRLYAGQAETFKKELDRLKAKQALDSAERERLAEEQRAGIELDRANQAAALQKALRHPQNGEAMVKRSDKSRVEVVGEVRVLVDQAKEPSQE